MRKILTRGLGVEEAYHLLLNVVAPRPIAFVSTVNKNGLRNAAPFCFFMGVTPSPPTVAFSVLRRGDQKKDTIRNIESSRDFVINLVDESLSQAMNVAGGNYPPDMSEFDVTGLTSVPGETVTAPRIAESPLHLECKLRTIVELGDLPASIVIGEVICVHVREALLADGRIDARKLRAVGRVGEDFYVRLSDLFELTRPA